MSYFWKSYKSSLQWCSCTCPPCPKPTFNIQSTIFDYADVKIRTTDVVMLCGHATFSILPLSTGLHCVPFCSTWVLRRGLLELGCSRPFKLLWLRLQRTNNKSDSLRSRAAGPRADTLMWPTRFSSGGIRWGWNEGSKKCKAWRDRLPRLQRLVSLSEASSITYDVKKAAHV